MDKDITPDPLQQISPINVEEIWAWSLLWLYDNVLNFNTLYQLAIFCFAGVLSLILHKIINPKVKSSIEKANIAFRYKRIVYNTRKLLLSFITIITLFSISQIAASQSIGVDTWLLKGIVKALFAWIAIRIMVQIISNNMVRNAMAAFIWVTAAFSIFSILDETIRVLDGIGYNIGDFHLSLFVVIKGGFYIFCLIYFALFLSSIADRRVSKSTNLTRTTKLLISKILRILLLAIALILGLVSSGIDLSLFAVFGGAIGLGIGFGLQRGVSNLFSGMMLLMDRSIEPGDVIELEQSGTFGWVEKMNARYTEIVTRDNKTYLIPNEELVTQRVVNWSHGNNEIRIGIDFGVHYKSDPHKVIEVAKEAAKKPARVLDTREPVCWITEFRDSSINFTLRFWIKDAHNGLTNIRGEVYLALWDALKENNIEIPYPHREVYIHQT